MAGLRPTVSPVSCASAAKLTKILISGVLGVGAKNDLEIGAAEFPSFKKLLRMWAGFSFHQNRKKPRSTRKELASQDTDLKRKVTRNLRKPMRKRPAKLCLKLARSC